MTNKRFFIALVFMFACRVYGNPVIKPIFLNELYFGPKGWLLELLGYPLRLDTCILATQLDTARFISRMQVNGESYVVVTKDSLDHPLKIKQSGDDVILYDLHYRSLDWFQFTTDPKGCSMNRGGADYIYLDRTPTLGFANDTSGAMVWICGSVFNTSGVPLAGTLVFAGGYSEGGIYTTSSDSTGKFKLWVLATGENTCGFFKDGFQHVDMKITTYPESTVVVNVVMQKNPDAVETEDTRSASRFFLSENYPNPFNAVTYFRYALPSDGFTDVGVYDMRARRVESLFQGFQRKGEYRLFWNAFENPSGIYFCRLQSGGMIRVKKWILIR
jgi:hypothetical protein